MKVLALCDFGFSLKISIEICENVFLLSPVLGIIDHRIDIHKIDQAQLEAKNQLRFTDNYTKLRLIFYASTHRFGQVFITFKIYFFIMKFLYGFHKYGYISCFFVYSIVKDVRIFILLVIWVTFLFGGGYKTTSSCCKTWSINVSGQNQFVNGMAFFSSPIFSLLYISKRILKAFDSLEPLETTKSNYSQTTIRHTYTPRNYKPRSID